MPIIRKWDRVLGKTWFWRIWLWQSSTPSSIKWQKSLLLNRVHLDFHKRIRLLKMRKQRIINYSPKVINLRLFQKKTMKVSRVLTGQVWQTLILKLNLLNRVLTIKDLLMTFRSPNMKCSKWSNLSTDSKTSCFSSTRTFC